MKTYKRIKQFGGWRLVLTYWEMGILFVICRDVLKQILKRRPLTEIYYNVEHRVMPILIKQYGALIRQRMEIYRAQGTDADKHSSYIWFCWMQGIENAPEMVKICYESLKKNLLDKDIIVITSENYNEWCHIPKYIIEKYEKGYIPHVAFSDLLRLDLIYEHGGTWLDASIYCSGWKDNSQLKEWAYNLLNAKLFLPRYVYKDGRFASIGSWFITAQSGNPTIATLRDMMYEYWRDYNCLVDYYMIHRFFSRIVYEYPEILEQMELGYCRPMLSLGRKIVETYDEEWYGKLTNQVCFHKMNYRYEAMAKRNPESYYNHVITNYQCLK